MESFGGIRGNWSNLKSWCSLKTLVDVLFVTWCKRITMENKRVFNSVDTRTAISSTFQKNTSGTAIKTKTSGTTTAVQLNQFGFKTVNKVEANTIVRNSYLPPVCMEKTKENDRQTPQGVWINKRSICQI